MTDRFEDAVRDALHGLPSATDEIPTYHDSWQRGRRRRFVKRSALAAAGALVFLAALTVNLGRIPGSGTAEVDDVATGIEVATPVFEPTPLATTSPLETPDDAATATVPSIEIPAPSAVAPVPTARAVAVPTPTSAPAAQPTPDVADPRPTVAATATPVPATAVPVPPTEQSAESDGASTADPALTSPNPNDDSAQSSETGPAGDPGEAAGTAEQPADPGSPDAPTPDPKPAFTSSALAADATILGGAARGIGIPCDIDRDGIADATCELLPEYSCSGEGDVRAGYSATDTNGDQVFDTCAAVDITVCDTTQDGIGDTPCIIELGTPRDEESVDDG